jgi:NAD(P)H-dependent flavin oxidoreductase YrpB (nitropropane dioxygenase family)
VEEGELEIGQIAGMVQDLPTCKELVERLTEEYAAAVARMPRTLEGKPS